MKKLKLAVTAVASLTLLASTFFPVVPMFLGRAGADPFSGDGDGISALDPYQITTCDELQQITENPDAYYALMSDVDCNGSAGWHGGDGFTPISGFTGHLDGRNYTVTDLAINLPATDGVGLFDSINGATIKNLKLSSLSVTGQNFTGGLAGQVGGNYDISHVSILGNVHGSAHTGGLIGVQYGGELNAVSFRGVLSGTDPLGGLVGTDVDGNISNSYVNASISGTTTIGGLVGVMASTGGTTPTINYSYAAGSIGGSSGIGGLVSVAQPSAAGIFISYSFADISTGGSSAIVADDGGGPVYLYDVYLDAYVNGASLCKNGAPPNGFTCVGVDLDGSSPDLFKNNTSQAPLDTWDFADTWTTSVSFPVLQDAPQFYVPALGHLLMTCSDLHNIDNDTSGHYVLGQDLDCTDQVVTPISTFSGTLDGGGHSIIDLEITSGGNVALFDTLSGTVENLFINGKMNGAKVGSIARHLLSGTISHVTSQVTINGTDDTGGLAADVDDSLIEDSAYIGSITTSGVYGGGLVGFGVGVTINDSYSIGKLSYNTSSAQAYGGLAGAFFLDGSAIHRSYSTMSITAISGSPNVGGLIGQNQGALAIDDSFFDGNLSLAGGGATTDPIEAQPDPSTTFNNDHSTDTDPTPDYFKGNGVNAPLDTWDFLNVWTGNSNDYPSLGQQTVPNPPSRLYPVVAGVHIIGPGWNPPYMNPGSPAVDDYIVQYRALGESSWTEFTTTDGGSLITDLLADTTYQVRVAAENSVGRSPFIDLITQHTGTPTTVHITNCQQLQDMSNDLEANYILDNNIDCSDSSSFNSGDGFMPIGGEEPESRFTGTLDGQHHHIANLTVDAVNGRQTGLFGTLGGHAQVFNLSISGTFTGGGSGDMVGSLAGEVLDYASVAAVSSDASVTNVGIFQGVGGLVGYMNDHASITESFTDGTVSIDGNPAITAGGLVGFMEGNSGISNSYSRETITFTSPGAYGDAGGLVGFMDDNTSIDQSYAVTTIHATGAVGGLIGGAIDHVAVTNSFGAYSFSLDDLSSVGNLFGAYDSDQDLVNDYYDGGPMLASFAPAGCAGDIFPDDPDGCTGLNLDGTDPGHFMNTTSEPPLTSWDFDNIWSRTDEYPVLQATYVIPDSDGDTGGSGNNSGGTTDTGGTSTGKKSTTTNPLASVSPEDVVAAITTPVDGIFLQNEQKPATGAVDALQGPNSLWQTIVDHKVADGAVGLFTLLFLVLLLWHRRKDA